MNKDHAQQRIKEMLDEMYLSDAKWHLHSQEYYGEFKEILDKIGVPEEEFMNEFPVVTVKIMAAFGSEKPAKAQELKPAPEKEPEPKKKTRKWGK